MPLSDAERAELAQAQATLEHPGLAVKLSSLVGKPIEKGLDMLPAAWATPLHDATRKALEAALKLALQSLGQGGVGSPAPASSPLLHKAAAVGSGMVGGAFGLPALVAELPLSTTIMLRSIADIARSQGEDLATVDAQLACMAVFALGGKAAEDDAAESGYFAARLALAQAVSQAAEYMARKTVADQAAPALVRLIATLAARFQIVVSQKAAAQAIPGLGAVMGGTVNYLFMDHFQAVSRAHFTVRRLERLHGPEAVQAAYEALPR